ncbi:MAG: DUF5362 family protein [Myxococcota bacterium]|nr:DUF5362 family protein [Myxococcota bacterium]
MNEQDSGASYEFSTEQNSVFSSLASAMKVVGIVSCILGALSLLPILANPGIIFINGPQAIILLVVGVWTTRASNSIKAIVDTQGNDIQHLMDAMSGLSKLYRLQRALMILCLVLFVLLGLFLVTVGGAFLSQISQVAN